MGMMLEEVYEAFKATGIDDEKAIAASKAVAGRENLLTKEDLLTVKSELQQDLLRLENKLTLRFGGMLGVAVGLIVALLKIVQ